MRVVYQWGLDPQFVLTNQLSDEAHAYFHLDEGEAVIRYLIRHFLVPAYRASTERVQEQARECLLWYAHCATDEQRQDVIDQQGYGWPGAIPQPNRLFFQWWWEELFTEPLPDAGDVCEAEVRSATPEEWTREDHWPSVTLDPDVVKFPRRDGKPPGFGAPAELYDKGPMTPPMRPRDSARFFRWEDQAEAIKHAQSVHADTGQRKVWVGFEHAVGEGYLIGGEEYRQTAWACVRFRDGGPVDSWPDLRKGWKPE